MHIPDTDPLLALFLHGADDPFALCTMAFLLPVAAENMLTVYRCARVTGPGTPAGASARSFAGPGRMSIAPWTGSLGTE